MKLCKDCKFCKDDNFCVYKYKSCITGETLDNILSECARESELYCGAEAKYFEKKDADKKLHLKVYDDIMYIFYGRESLGYICSYGFVRVLTVPSERKTYKQWVDDGMKVDTNSVVEWKDGMYAINNDHILKRLNINYGNIYNFRSCRPVYRCEDENVQRHYGCNTPIVC